MAYSLVYSPEVNPSESEVRFICSDNKVHFRFKDFKRNEHVQGFEKKLIYLMEYLFNFCYKPSLTGDTPVEKEELLENFLQSSDVKTLNKILADNIPTNKFKGIKAYFNYNKKYDCKPFGDIDDNYFPSKGQNSLLDFSCKLRLGDFGIRRFLFDDRYSILLHNDYKDNINKKFKNKFINKSKSTGDDLLVKLW